MNHQPPLSPNLDGAAPFFAQQAVLFSAELNSTYLRDHLKQSDGLTAAAAASLATSKLQWILQSTRRELSGLFDEAEIHTLMDCFQGELFFPDLFNSLASDLCGHLGIEFDDVEESEVAILANKLLELTPSQRATLADALEQAWHRGLKSGQSPKEFFATLGIALG